MSGRREAVATCTGERMDRGPTRLRQQTENGSSGSARGAAGGWRATCSGEQADRGPAPWKQQTESVSRERVPPSISRSSGALVCSLDRG